MVGQHLNIPFMARTISKMQLTNAEREYIISTFALAIKAELPKFDLAKWKQSCQSATIIIDDRTIPRPAPEKYTTLQIVSSALAYKFSEAKNAQSMIDHYSKLHPQFTFLLDKTTDFMDILVVVYEGSEKLGWLK